MSQVNSKEYWDGRFEDNWESFNGLEQTKAFVKLMIDNLPNEIIEYLESRTTSVLDWGCAVGVGVKEFAESFEKAIVTGLDFSDVAINKSKELLPEYNFVAGSLDKHRQHYDMIYTSNCLEHFKDPYQWLKQILTYTNKYAVVLVPYNEELTVSWSEHQFSFTEKSFHNKYCGFTKIFEKVIDECSHCWPYGSQFLVVYKK